MSVVSEDTTKDFKITDEKDINDPKVSEEILETSKQKRFIEERDADLVQWFETRNQTTEITHIISPRAVLWGVLNIVASHGGDYFLGLDVPPEFISDYTQIQDSFFPSFLEIIRNAATDNPDAFDTFVQIPIEDPRLNEVFMYYQNFIRMVVSDPRNMIITSKQYNDEYTPLRREARKMYPKDKGASFDIISQQHETLARAGRISQLIHPKAKFLQGKAIERTRRINLEEYPNKWERKPTGEITYEQILQFAMELNKNYQGILLEI